jgi:predicted PhzF superfamily epimerase YddE/YHI9
MSTPIFKVDAFAEEPFSGNPAGVCLLESAPPEDWMQKVAAEMNVAETAFLVPRDDGFDLRWFTPTVEVDLCGHATLASAHVLWETERLTSSAVARFWTKSGELTCRKEAAGIVMDFPAEVVSAAPPPPGLEAGLGAPFSFCGRNRMDYLVEVADEATVRRVEPDLRALMKYPVRGVIVTARASSSGLDFVSRFFAPAAGVDEDPVTGSAHCALAPYWGAKLGKTEMLGYQASKRGGRVGVRLAGGRVQLIGRAVTILRGELAV